MPHLIYRCINTGRRYNNGGWETTVMMIEKKPMMELDDVGAVDF